MSYLIAIIGLLGFLVCCYFILRIDMVRDVSISFIYDPDLYPKAYEMLPTFEQMVYGWRHQLRWKKDQWVEYVQLLGKPEKETA